MQADGGSSTDDMNQMAKIMHKFYFNRLGVLPSRRACDWQVFQVGPTPAVELSCRKACDW